MSDLNFKKQQIRELLKIHYGFEKFLPGQERAIDAILEGRDVLAVMPTGGGKSLIFQLPSLILEGVTIVVSPLIALMKDQVDFLERVGIPATFINSSISLDEARERIEKIKSGHYRLLYVAPERFYNDEFIAALAKIKVSLFAVDEAHCISQWGHDFRPSYMRLKKTIELLGRPPVAALTATATPEVKEDIAKQLDLKNPEMVITGFARPNLRFGVAQASDREKLNIIMEAVRNFDGKCGIIYAGTRAKAEEITEMLLENQIEAVNYHAGMDNDSRQWAQENFMRGGTKIIVATNAFGLGIDKKNIRFVIHHDIPGTVEAYYQEAGRAGRDGEESFCLLFYAPKDRYLREFFIKGDNPSPEIILKVYEILLSYGQEKIITTYAEIMEGLDADVPDMAVGTSLKILEKEGYLSRNSEKVSAAYLRFFNDFEKTMDFVSKKAKKQVEILEKLEKRFGGELRSGLEINLDETAGILEVGRDSLVRTLNSLKKSELIEYSPPKRGTEINILKRAEPNEVKLDFFALREKAVRAYDKLDQMENYIFHYGCRQKFILDYFSDLEARECGKCDNCLGAVSRKTSPQPSPYKGEGGNKKSPLSITAEAGQGRVAPTLSRRRGVFAGRAKKIEANFEDIKVEKKTLNTKLTQLETLELFNKGRSVAEIAAERGLAEGTIFAHLAFLIEKKLIKDIDRLVDKKRQEKITEAIAKVGGDKLKPIKEYLGDEFSYEEIKIVWAFIKTNK